MTTQSTQTKHPPGTTDNISSGATNFQNPLLMQQNLSAQQRQAKMKGSEKQIPKQVLDQLQATRHRQTLLNRQKLRTNLLSESMSGSQRDTENHPILIGMFSMFSTIFSMIALTYITKFYGCIECSSVSEEGHNSLNIVWGTCVMEIVVGIALIGASFFIFRSIKNNEAPMKMTAGFYIAFSLLLLIADSIILGTIENSKYLRAIRTKLKKRTFQAFRGIMIFLIFFRLICIGVFTFIIIRWGIAKAAKAAEKAVELAPQIATTASSVATVATAMKSAK